MSKRSAGLLPFRRNAGIVEVFLVHPGGPLWAKKDDGAWSISKGEFLEGEEPLAAARREFEEETGAAPSGEFVALEPLRQAGGKLVYAWAIENDLDPAAVQSNMFRMEWPPRSGRYQEFPEVDRADWFTIDRAREKMLKSQLPFLDRLLRVLGERDA
jgi:predicted NUDIX family NTP pyrophosphohydrolase